MNKIELLDDAKEELCKIMNEDSSEYNESNYEESDCGQNIESDSFLWMKDMSLMLFRKKIVITKEKNY